MLKIKKSTEKTMRKISAFMLDKRGQGALDTALTVLVSVVLMALLLAGLYALTKDNILPNLQQRITDMFNYSN